MEGTVNHYSLMLLASSLALMPLVANSQDEQTIELDLRGSIEPRCEITNITPARLDFSRSESGTVNFDVYCNLDMSIGISARNGALVNEEAVAGSGYTAALAREYSVQLSLDAFDFTRQVQSRELVSGVKFDITEGIVYQTTGALDINLYQPIAGGYAGEYVDEIRIAVSPSLSQAVPD